MADKDGWQGFFPYYAGFSERFARDVLRSAELNSSAVVADPWNGSGTTTYVASELGLVSQGYDINPVMVIAARARLLPSSEADSIEPIAKDIVKNARVAKSARHDDPLRKWFTDATVRSIRAIERSLRRRLLGSLTLSATGTRLDRISGLAATFYVALFAVCRALCSDYRSTNPTWLRVPSIYDRRIRATGDKIGERFVSHLKGMAAALASRKLGKQGDFGLTNILVMDTSSATVCKESVDFILTSPPYCTRIDYAAASRIELSILSELMDIDETALSRRMTGSTRVPPHLVEPRRNWGDRCNSFLNALRQHPSKASGGYYYKTHLDYFDKMDRSVQAISDMLKPGGQAILVVQDSYYKEIHNDLPSILAELSEANGLTLQRREDFRIARSMAGINPYTKRYGRSAGVTEAVLCFQKVRKLSYG